MNFISPEEKTEFKKQIQQSCISLLEKRILAASAAMREAQESANSEEKSSAGDKYETSRAMGQLSRDMNAKQMEEAQRDLSFINALPVSSVLQTVQPGSVVVCGKNIFFISLGLGAIEVGGQKVVLLSPGAPVARLLEEKKPGDSFLFNGNETKITDVF